jgi:hypothetical protein
MPAGKRWATRFTVIAVDTITLVGASHDGRIAAIRLSHGVAELWSADRDLSRFPALPVRNPLIAESGPAISATCRSLPSPLPLR